MNRLGQPSIWLIIDPATIGRRTKASERSIARNGEGTERREGPRAIPALLFCLCANKVCLFPLLASFLFLRRPAAARCSRSPRSGKLPVPLLLLPRGGRGGTINWGEMELRSCSASFESPDHPWACREWTILLAECNSNRFRKAFNSTASVAI